LARNRHPCQRSFTSTVQSTVRFSPTLSHCRCKSIRSAGNVAGKILSEAFHVIPFPGDPSRDDSDDQLPIFCNHLVFALGTVAAAYDGHVNAAITFPVPLFEYESDETKRCAVRSPFFFLFASYVPFSAFSSRQIDALGRRYPPIGVLFSLYFYSPFCTSSLPSTTHHPPFRVFALRRY
jgi:hypothetical protein